MAGETTTIDEMEEFRQRARSWLAEHMPKTTGTRRPGADPYEGRLSDEERVARARMLQRTLFEGGFAGLVFPTEYGGQGLTPAHQRVFAEESAGYEMPLWLNMSTLAILAPTLLEFGTEEQKKRHIPAILRGDEFWAQLLSEPTGGSDLAGAVTRATRDGDVWILSGSKLWSSGAHRRDYGMCLARTDWDVPKHRGLSMFIVKLRQPGVEVVPIKQVNGSTEFCQEFFDDVVLPADSRVGEVNDGWTVASRMLIFERNAVGGGSPFAGGARGGSRRGTKKRGVEHELLDLARATGQADDAHARQLVAEAHVRSTVRGQLVQRVSAGIRTGKMPGPASSMLKLMTSTTSVRLTTIGLELAHTDGVTWKKGETNASRYGEQFLSRQTICLGGGTNEMQRNIISERVLGMPREDAGDRDVPFSQVRTNRIPTRRG
jgi:alkylation response protein AidB-like acyl-CoA dehydrogenase